VASVGIGGLVLAAAVACVSAQTPAPAAAQMSAPAAAHTPAPAKADAADQNDARFKISQVERLLEGAVEHGAKLIHNRLQAVLPAEMLVGENARVRGFRLEGYGVFFDVEVPTVQTAFLSSLRMLDQNDLGLESALKTIRTHIERARDTNLEQALKRVELQVAPMTSVMSSSAPAAAGAPATGAPAAASAEVPQPPADPILSDPNETYRTEVKTQIMNTMLDAVQISIGADEWLTVGARRRDNDRPLFAPADTDAGTMVIRIRGADLAALRAGRLSREDALKAMEVRVF